MPDNSIHPFASEQQQQQQQQQSTQQEYLSLINDLNQEFDINQPTDPLQFCFNFFLKRLLHERSQKRHASTPTFIQGKLFLYVVFIHITNGIL
jgi:16S rRNA G527 N7-methylase RsmG